MDAALHPVQIQSMLLSATCRKAQSNANLQTVKKNSVLLSEISMKGFTDTDLQSIQNPGHALVRYKQGMLAKCWLTFYLKPRAWSCQKQAGRASQMLTYILFKTQSMLLSATSIWDHMLAYRLFKMKHALIKNKQEMLARCWLTSYLKPRAWSCQQQADKTYQMLLYILFKMQSMLLLATSRKG